MIWCKGLVHNMIQQIHFPSHASQFSPSSFFFLFFPSFLPLLPSLHFLPSLFGHIGTVTRQVTNKTIRSLCASLRAFRQGLKAIRRVLVNFSGITQKAAKLVNGVWVYVATSISSDAEKVGGVQYVERLQRRGSGGKARRYLYRMRIYGLNSDSFRDKNYVWRNEESNHQRNQTLLGSFC